MPARGITSRSRTTRSWSPRKHHRHTCLNGDGGLRAQERPIPENGHVMHNVAYVCFKPEKPPCGGMSRNFLRLSPPQSPWRDIPQESPNELMRSKQSTIEVYAQSVATSSASQTSVMRNPLSDPIRSTSSPTETDSTESKLMAQARPIGSVSGSRRTSLGSPRTFVVQGATSARRKLGMAASLERMTTGRRPISGGSHHHSSPRFGNSLTMMLHFGTTEGRPSRLPRRVAGLHTPPGTPNRSQLSDAVEVEQ